MRDVRIWGARGTVALLAAVGCLAMAGDAALAQVGGAFVASSDDGSGDTFALTASGDVYLRSHEFWYYEGNFVEEAGVGERGGQFSAIGYESGNRYALTTGGDVYHRFQENWYYEGNFLVQTEGVGGNGEFVGFSVWTRNIYGTTAAGDLYVRWSGGQWDYLGNFIEGTGGPVSLAKRSFGKTKANFR